MCLAVELFILISSVFKLVEGTISLYIDQTNQYKTNVCYYSVLGLVLSKLQVKACRYLTEIRVSSSYQ